MACIKGAKIMGSNRLGKWHKNGVQRFPTGRVLIGLVMALALVLSIAAQNEKQAETQKKEVFPRPTGVIFRNKID